MIEIKEALSIIEKSVSTTRDLKVKKLSDAQNSVLAKDVFSTIDMPPFRQSAMDGYAIHIHSDTHYKLIGEVKAGDPTRFILNPGEAVRIFTGAAVPDTADAVVIQERVERDNQKITVKSDIRAQMNIRPLGEQIKAGELALPKGHHLNPASIAFLASLGIEAVETFKNPSLCIIITGNELQEAGSPLSYGQIYESNGIMLKTALLKSGYGMADILRIKDNYDITLSTLKEALINYDFLIVSGGISVGDYDFVGKALLELGVDELFYKVKQKPGKPLFFGKTASSYVFALPGNPASALSCFYIYVLKALHLFQGHTDFGLNTLKAISKSEFKKSGDRPQFLKAFYDNEKVEILDGQNSSMLHTFARANALAFIPSHQMQIRINDEVEVILLPNN